MKRFLFVVMAIFMTGCSVYYDARDIRDLSRPASQNVNHIRKEGLCISAEHLDSRKSEEYLGKDVSSSGYVPILVNIENTGDRGFKIEKNSISGVSQKGDNLPLITASEVLEQNAYSHMRALPFWIIIIPGIFVAFNIHSSVDQANESMRVDYETKNLQDVVLEPKGVNQGIVFLKASSQELDHLLFKVQKRGKTELDTTIDIEMRVPIK